MLPVVLRRAKSIKLCIQRKPIFVPDTSIRSYQNSSVLSTVLPHACPFFLFISAIHWRTQLFVVEGKTGKKEEKWAEVTCTEGQVSALEIDSAE